MTHSTTLLAGASLGALLMGGLYYAADRVDLSALVTPAEAATAPADAPLAVVEVVAAEARAITRWDEFTGRFEAVDEVAIRARVSGYLDAVHYAKFRKIEPARAVAAAAKAEASLHRSNAWPMPILQETTDRIGEISSEIRPVGNEIKDLEEAMLGISRHSPDIRWAHQAKRMLQWKMDR